MVQLNKEPVWVCFEMARVLAAHAIQRLWPVRRVPIIHAILKNYRKYRQHGTILKSNKVKMQWEISLAFSYIVIKGEIKDKKLWFQFITSFCLLQLIAQSIFVRF